MKRADVAIVGGGPGGASCALTLAEHGVSSTIIEKEAFPRYHIGESMTGECGNTVRMFGLERAMAQSGYPIKRGVRVFNPRGAHAFWIPVMARDLASGSLVEATTWQVPRDHFDAVMLGAAKARGSEIIRGEALDVIRSGDRIAGVRVKSADLGTIDVEASVVVDASGQSAFLSRCGVVGRKQRGRYDNQIAIFSQVTGAIRDAEPGDGNTLIFYQKPNHWAWFIPLDAERVSIGVVVPTEYFKGAGLTLDGFLKREVASLNPNLTDRIGNVTYTEPVRSASNYSYEIEEYTGPGYLCVGDSHRFIDPIFSFGMHFAVKEGQLAAETISQHLASVTKDVASAGDNPFAEYQKLTTLGMDAIQDLIDAFWFRPLQFAFITHHQHRDDIIDLFAGRVYEEEPSAGLVEIRHVLGEAGIGRHGRTAMAARH